MLVGYARVSTHDQGAGLEAQVRDLQAFRLKLPDGTDAAVERVFSEEASAVKICLNAKARANPDLPRKMIKDARPQLAECLVFMRKGDTLVVTKPDRLARNTQQLLEIEADLVDRGCFLIVLSMSGFQLDTRNPTSKLLLTMMAAIATWERDIMIERQREGIAKALGDPRKYRGRQRDPKRTIAVMRALSQGHGPQAIANALGIATTTVDRIRWGSVKAVDPALRPPLPPLTTVYLGKRVRQDPNMLGKPLDMKELMGPWNDWDISATDPHALGQALPMDDLPDL